MKLQSQHTVIVGTLQPQNLSNMFVMHTEYLDKIM